MKLLLKIVASFVVLVLFGLGLLLWNLNPLIDSLRPSVTEELSKLIGHRVEIGSLSLSLFPRTGINLKKVKLESAEEDTFVDSLLLETNLRDIFSKKVQVTKLSLSDVSLRISKKKDGSIFLGSLPLLLKSAKEPSPQTPAPQTQSQTAKQPPAEGAFSVVLSDGQISDLDLIFIDESLTPAQEIRLENLQAELKNISESAPGTLSLSADLLGTKSKNLSASGKISLRKTRLGLPELDLLISLEHLSLEKLSALIQAYGINATGMELKEEATIGCRISINQQGIKLEPSADLSSSAITLPTMSKQAGPNFTLKSSFLPEFGNTLAIPANTIPRTSGEFSLQAEDLQLTSKNSPPIAISDLAINSKISGERLELSSLSLKVNGEPISATAVFILNDLMLPVSGSLEPLKVSAFEGSLSGKTQISLRDKQVSLDVGGSGFDLERLSKALMGSGALGASGKVKLISLKARTPLSAPKPSTKGVLALELENGSIKGVNILRETLSGIDKIPGIEGSFSAYVPEKYRPLLQENSTRFEKLTLNALITGDTVTIESLQLTHQLFTLYGKGNYRLDGSLLLNAQFKLTPEVSQEITSKHSKLKVLLDKQGQFVVPVDIKKEQGGTPLIFPDVETLGELALKNSAKEGAKKAVEKYVPGAGSLIDSLF